MESSTTQTERKNQHLLKIMREVNFFSIYCLEAQDQNQALQMYNTPYK